jgi:GDPmannose 4,6-dehydratase
MKTALITGVLGQDGSLLAELLLAKGYRVIGLELFAPAKPPIGVKLEVADVRDRTAVEASISRANPSEIYHLAGQSSVGYSFGAPVETFESVALGTLNVLEAARNAKQKPRVLVACSGEIFGDTGGELATERSPYRPTSPYGAAKGAAAHLTATYRQSYDLFACSAFFYNHESPRRPERFVTRKVVRGACRIARGLDKGKLELGDTSVVRDWGWAPEYVDAAWRMLSLAQPVDLVIATGKSCSLEHFVERAFACVGLKAADHVVKSERLVRSAEIPAMHADPALAAEKLGWRASVKVDEVIERLVAAEQATLDREAGVV